MRYGPPRALLNVIPPLAWNHLHYSSEVWISGSYTRLWCFNKAPRESYQHLFFFFFSEITPLRTFSNFQKQLLVSQFTLKFKREICLPCKHNQTEEGLKKKSCHVAGLNLVLFIEDETPDVGEAGCYSWFRAFHLHLTLWCCAVTSSAYVFHSVSHSTCMSLRMLKASKAPIISSVGWDSQIRFSYLFFFFVSTTIMSHWNTHLLTWLVKNLAGDKHVPLVDIHWTLFHMKLLYY